MFQYTCLNPISHVGLDLLTDDYKKTDDINAAEAVLVRSASMHEMDLPEFNCSGKSRSRSQQYSA